MRDRRASLRCSQAFASRQSAAHGIGDTCKLTRFLLRSARQRTAGRRRGFSARRTRHRPERVVHATRSWRGSSVTRALHRSSRGRPRHPTLLRMLRAPCVDEIAASRVRIRKEVARHAIHPPLRQPGGRSLVDECGRLQAVALSVLPPCSAARCGGAPDGRAESSLEGILVAEAPLEVSAVTCVGWSVGHQSSKLMKSPVCEGRGRRRAGEPGAGFTFPSGFSAS